MKKLVIFLAVLALARSDTPSEAVVKSSSEPQAQQPIAEKDKRGVSVTPASAGLLSVTPTLQTVQQPLQYVAPAAAHAAIVPSAVQYVTPQAHVAYVQHPYLAHHQPYYQHAPQVYVQQAAAYSYPQQYYSHPAAVAYSGAANNYYPQAYYSPYLQNQAYYPQYRAHQGYINHPSAAHLARAQYTTGPALRPVTSLYRA